VPGKMVLIAPESDGKGNVRTTLSTQGMSRSEMLAVLFEVSCTLAVNPASWGPDEERN